MTEEQKAPIEDLREYSQTSNQELKETKDLKEENKKEPEEKDLKVLTENALIGEYQTYMEN